VIGQPLQSRVNGADRGIVRNAYGEFQGLGRETSGRMFSYTPRPAQPRPPIAPPPEPMIEPAPPSEPLEEPLPGPAPLPDEWLRSRGEGAEAPPGTTPTGTSPAEAAVPPGASGRAAPAVARSAQLAFTVPPPGNSPGSRIAAVLRRAPRIGTGSDIQVVLESDTAVLRGRVGSAADRELAEILARFEPGVWRVRNELIVDSPATVARSLK